VCQTDLNLKKKSKEAIRFRTWGFAHCSSGRSPASIDSIGIGNSIKLRPSRRFESSLGINPLRGYLSYQVVLNQWHFSFLCTISSRYAPSFVGIHVVWALCFGSFLLHSNSLESSSRTFTMPVACLLLSSIFSKESGVIQFTEASRRKSRSTLV